MRRDVHRSPAAWVIAGCLLVAFAVLPLVVVAAAPGLDAGAFVCRGRVEARLAETMQGKLQFLLVEALEGDPPGERFVITVDQDYTAGLCPESDGNAEEDGPDVVVPGATFWLQGTLMDRETYYGEQYLFFGYPQLYVSQVKEGLLWPSQVGRLRTLYGAPLVAPVSVYLVGALPFMEEYSARSWALVFGRFFLVCGTVAVAILYRRRRRRWMPCLAWVVGAYLLAAVALAIPGL